MVSLASICTDLLRGDDPDRLFTWPPDVFVLTSRALGTSDAYRSIVSPPAKRRWAAGAEWVSRIEAGGRAWFEFCNEGSWIERRSVGDLHAGSDEIHRLPPAVQEAWSWLRTHYWTAPLDEMCQRAGETEWQALQHLVALHAMADEACRSLFGAGRPEDRTGRFTVAAWGRIGLKDGDDHTSLATLDRSRGCVLPKTHTTQVGLTLRSLSHYLAYHRYATGVQWWRPYATQVTSSSWGNFADENDRTFTILLFPWPYLVQMSMFAPMPVRSADLPDGFGYFCFDPEPRSDDSLRQVLRAVVDAAREELGGNRVDLLVMPETALATEEWQPLLRGFGGREGPGFKSYVVGLRTQAGPSDEDGDGFGENKAEIGFSDGSSTFDHIVQHKHHRWRLDHVQIRGYNLAQQLHPETTWWEGIRIPNRMVSFVEPSHGLTVCPLICEDLARQDPVASMLRAVGPSLVICLLMDGPQLASRWSSKYASVLADDPGSSVLTLTSKGMVDRWSSPFATSREIVALWRDPFGSTQELDLAGADALLLRVRCQSFTEYTVDGRTAQRQNLVLDGVTRIRTGSN